MIRLSAAVTSLAALAMAATPAAALDLPTPLGAPKVERQMDANGWGYGRRHRDRGIDTGDVVAGVLVLGAIAAIASSSRSNSRDRYEESYPRRAPANAGYRDDYRSPNSSDSGLDRAVDMCVDQVERGSDRVESVDNAARVADGWRVSGALAGGEGWRCWIDNDGRIRSVDLNDGYAGYEGSEAGYVSAAAEGQLSDDTYARARAATRYAGADARYADTSRAVDADLNSGPVPAYPGGPLPGDEGYEESIGG